MEIALEKLPIEERVSLLKQLWDSVKQDNPEALKFIQDEQAISKQDYRVVKRLGALPDLVVPDDFDEIEVTDFDGGNLKRRVMKNKQTDNEVNVFDEFFGILKSDKSVTLEEMDKAIALEGGKL